MQKAKLMITRQNDFIDSLKDLIGKSNKSSELEELV